jgi:hypothetical protein
MPAASEEGLVAKRFCQNHFAITPHYQYNLNFYDTIFDGRLIGYLKNLTSKPL